jgi:hypothetical protein
MANKRPREQTGDDPFDNFSNVVTEAVRPTQPSRSERDEALGTDELFMSDDDDGDGEAGGGSGPRMERAVRTNVGYDDDEYDDDDDDDDDLGGRPKKKKKSSGKCRLVHTQPMHRGKLRESRLIDNQAESQLMGPDPTAEASEAAVHGNDAAAATGLMEVPARGFIETDIPMDSSDDSDSEDGDSGNWRPDRPGATSLNVEDLCVAYTEALRSRRMPAEMARSFTNWRCWYCKHREEMRQIPAAQRSTVMKAFGTALEEYETETLDAQASILYQLWAEVVLQPSLRGEREPVAEDDMMTVERFMICLRDHISPTERPMAAVSHMTRQLTLLTELTSDYWEVTNTVEDEDGNVRHITGLNHHAISAYLSAAKLLGGLITSSNGGRFKRSSQSQPAATAVESEAIRSGLRLRAVRRGVPNSRQFS